MRLDGKSICAVIDSIKMKKLLFKLLFHRSGKPRRWFAFVLFTDGMAVRPLFRRIVYKTNGRMRPRFAYWVNQASKQAGNAGTITGSTQALRPEEAILQAMAPFEASVKSRRNKLPPATLLTRDALAEHIDVASSAASGKMVIAISQDNYLEIQAGVQLCIQHEQALAVEQGHSYLQIHPWYPLPRLAHVEEEPDTIIALILNGNAIGTCRTSTLIEVIERAATKSREISVVVHHLLGHLPAQVAELIQATGSASCVLWLHDFFSLCPSYILQRNSLKFCSAPPVTSNACMLCVYGAERTTHLKRLQAFFETVNVDIASPSAITAEFWQEKSDLKSASLTVLPHMTLEIVPRTPALSRPSKPQITVGYLGEQSEHKGWPVFTSLMHEHTGRGIYRFVVMSRKQPGMGEDAWAPVRVTAANPTAMSDAVAAEDVDIVLHWPNWPETFSFTTFEALAGFAYVITNAGSGNVAAAVQKTGRGAILSGNEDLFEFFRDGRANALASRRREAKLTTEILHHHSDMSFPLIRKYRQ
jgi:hypothetical protein